MNKANSDMIKINVDTPGNVKAFFRKIFGMENRKEL